MVFKCLSILFTQKARVVATGQLAAVKIIKLEAGEELDEVLNEVNFLRDCSHRNVVSYIGCYMKRGTVKGQKHIWVRSVHKGSISRKDSNIQNNLQIVMEYCGGGSVEAAYKGGFFLSENAHSSLDNVRKI
ncbi:Mitogen-activated protein kinase kinase kinase kinase 3 [Quaeritorhiza haematococci]|nr:Mitogen-activated protein kinase kinase kinase kinase 3 [Quaeritorhiza haematococci]